MGLVIPILAAAGIGGLASYLGSRKQSQAIGESTQAQLQGQREAQGFLKEGIATGRGDLMSQFGTAESQLAPYGHFGPFAMSNIHGLLSGQIPVQETPGYKFRTKEAEKAINRMHQARGFSGAALKDITRFSQGLASDAYQQQIGNLFSLANMGQGAASQAANMRSQLGTSLANLGIGQGTQMANLAMQGGRIAGEAPIQQANAFTGGLQNMSNIASQGMQNYMFNMLRSPQNYPGLYSGRT